MHFTKKTLAVVGILLLMGGCASSRQDTRPKLSTDNARQFVSVARLAERHGEEDKAREVYEELIANGMELQTANHRLGVIKAKGNSLSAAKQHFAAAREAGLDTIDFRIDEAFATMLQGDSHAAEQALQQILESEPTHKRALNNLAIIYASQRNFEQSLALSRRATNSAGAYANLGYLLTQYGDLISAEQSYHRALEEDPELSIAANGLLQIDSIKRKQANAYEVALLKECIPPSPAIRLASFDEPEVSD